MTRYVHHVDLYASCRVYHACVEPACLTTGPRLSDVWAGRAFRARRACWSSGGLSTPAWGMGSGPGIAIGAASVSPARRPQGSGSSDNSEAFGDSSQIKPRGSSQGCWSRTAAPVKDAGQGNPLVKVAPVKDGVPVARPGAADPSPPWWDEEASVERLDTSCVSPFSKARSDEKSKQALGGGGSRMVRVMTSAPRHPSRMRPGHLPDLH